MQQHETEVDTVHELRKLIKIATTVLHVQNEKNVSKLLGIVKENFYKIPGYFKIFTN